MRYFFAGPRKQRDFTSILKKLRCSTIRTRVLDQGVLLGTLRSKTLAERSPAEK
jgi:hypothetical protein